MIHRTKNLTLLDFVFFVALLDLRFAFSCFRTTIHDPKAGRPCLVHFTRRVRSGRNHCNSCGRFPALAVFRRMSTLQSAGISL